MKPGLGWRLVMNFQWVPSDVTGFFHPWMTCRAQRKGTKRCSQSSPAGKGREREEFHEGGPQE